MNIADRAYNEGDLVYADNTLYKVMAPTASYFCSSHSSIDTEKLCDNIEKMQRDPDYGRACLPADTIIRGNTIPMMTLAEYNALPAYQRSTYYEITDTYPINVSEVKFGEPVFKPIRYRSTCMCCGAPVNDYGKCEYCGTAHQYAD